MIKRTKEEKKEIRLRAFHVAAVFTTKGEWDNETGLLLIKESETMSDQLIGMLEEKAAELEAK